MRNILILVAFLAWGGYKNAIAVQQCPGGTGDDVVTVGDDCTYTGHNDMLTDSRCGEEDSLLGGTFLCTVLYCNGSCYCGRTCPSTSKSCPNNCPSTEWDLTPSALGYEVRCNENYHCDSRCAAGYYGSIVTCGINGNVCSGCTKCPDYENTNLQIASSPTSNAGATTAEECFIPVNSSFTDNLGTGKITTACYY